MYGAHQEEQLARQSEYVVEPSVLGWHEHSARTSCTYLAPGCGAVRHEVDGAPRFTLAMTS